MDKQLFRFENTNKIFAKIQIFRVLAQFLYIFRAELLQVQLFSEKGIVQMGRALIIGCGGVASVVIHKCCQNSEIFEEIMIASLSPNATL